MQAGRAAVEAAGSDASGREVGGASEIGNLWGLNVYMGNSDGSPWLMLRDSVWVAFEALTQFG